VINIDSFSFSCCCWRCCSGHSFFSLTFFIVVQRLEGSLRLLWGWWIDEIGDKKSRSRYTIVHRSIR
jgi:hypothetical protein